MRKEEERTKRIAEKQVGDESKPLSTPQAQPEMTLENERSAVPESAVSEPAPYFDAASLAEPIEPASQSSRTEADFTDQENPKQSPIEEQPRSFTYETNEAEAVSEVDPTLLDPALRESVIDELSSPEKDNKEQRPSDPSHAELVAARVLSAPSINDVPIEEVTKAVRDANNVHQDLAADPSRLSEAKEFEERNVRQDFVVDSSHVSETSKGPGATNEPPSVLPGPSHPAKGTTLDDITVHQGLVSDPPQVSQASNSAPRSPKGESRVTSWLKTKFGRRTAKSHEPQIDGGNQDPVSLEDDERHKGDSRRTSQSISSISSDEGTMEKGPVLGQEKLSAHEDLKEAHNDPGMGNSSEEQVPSGTSKDVGHVHDNHARDSKFQENL